MRNFVNSLYLHFPYCKHLCNYCDFYKFKTEGEFLDLRIYHNYLLKQLEQHNKLLITHEFKVSPLKTIFIGGGTPSLWGKEGALFLKNFITNEANWKIDQQLSDFEWTMEVNPNSFTEEIFESFSEIGVNRWSLGLQAFDDFYLSKLDRIHRVDEIHRALSLLKKYQANYSVDFMLGLPLSHIKKRNVIEEINKVLEYNPSHFSAYILTVKNNYKHYDELPSEEYLENEYLNVCDYFNKMGFLQYEVSNFAKKGRESVHNLQYWKSQSVMALGPSATGLLANGHLQLRYKWRGLDLENCSFSTEFLDEKAQGLEKKYLTLRTNQGLDVSKENESLITNWFNQGLVMQKKPLILSSKGYLVMDSLISSLR